MDRMYNRDLVSFEEREKVYPDKSTRKVRHYSITDAGRKALKLSRQLHEEMAAPSITETRTNAGVADSSENSIMRNLIIARPGARMRNS